MEQERYSEVIQQKLQVYAVSQLLVVGVNTRLALQIRIDGLLLLSQFLSRLDEQEVIKIMPGILSAMVKLLSQVHLSMKKMATLVIATIISRGGVCISQDDTSTDQKLCLVLDRVDQVVMQESSSIAQSIIEQFLPCYAALINPEQSRVRVISLIVHAYTHLMSSSPSFKYLNTSTQYNNDVKQQIIDCLSLKLLSRLLADMLLEFNGVCYSVDDEKRVMYINKMNGLCNLTDTNTVPADMVLDGILFLYTPSRQQKVQSEDNSSQRGMSCIQFQNFNSADLERALEQFIQYVDLYSLVMPLLDRLNDQYCQDRIAVIITLCAVVHRLPLHLKLRLLEDLSILLVSPTAAENVVDDDQLYFAQLICRIYDNLEGGDIKQKQVTARVLLYSLQNHLTDCVKSISGCYQSLGDLDDSDQSIAQLLKLFRNEIMNVLVVDLKHSQYIVKSLSIMTGWIQLVGPEFLQYSSTLISSVLNRLRKSVTEVEDILASLSFFQECIVLVVDIQCKSDYGKSSQYERCVEGQVSQLSIKYSCASGSVLRWVAEQTVHSDDGDEYDGTQDNEKLFTADEAAARQIVDSLVDFISHDSFAVRLAALKICIVGIDILNDPENVAMLELWWPYLLQMLEDQQSNSIQIVCQYLQRFLQKTGNLQIKRVKDDVIPKILSRIWCLQGKVDVHSQQFAAGLACIKFMQYLIKINAVSKSQQVQLAVFCLTFSGQKANLKEQVLDLQRELNQDILEYTISVNAKSTKFNRDITHQNRNRSSIKL
ncbi:hypothetical protein MIR68_003008 [Amoeboaphelidium protococcarum]|nr:hypothetical protein MIR68_003008 [Amoeboaphelidium protococcarum]